jgi:uncharacterized protein (DUF2126 family)/transglutaminase-like putative cysteine protease
MAVTVSLNHTTHYRYERPASLSPQTIRLRPAPHCRTPILSYGLKVSPANHFLNWMQDPQGNYQARVVFPEKVSEFKVEVSVVAEMVTINPFDFFVESYAENFPFEYEPTLKDELEPYLDPPVDTGPLWDELFKKIDRSERHIVDFLVALNSVVNGAVKYLIRMEPGIQTPEETLVKGAGSCRDSAWLVISLLRKLGLAARFASGYLIQLTADQKAIDGPSGPETDFTDLHAWAEVYLPGAGWVGLDATSGLFAGEGHIPLACSPNPVSASPISGSLEDVKTEFEFHMAVERVLDLPRATKPYQDKTWEAILAAGHSADKKLAKNGIALTMGGEPTFISCDNPDAPEWNGAAVGQEKFELSENLLRRLWKRFGPGGFLHMGQGKWYPGESLPRWAHSCIWRKDGKPLWKNPARLAQTTKPGKATTKDAEAFGRTLAGMLGIKSDYLIPAYEDAGYYLWKERKIPVNLDTIDNRLSDPEERARFAKIFEQGLGQPAGWTLPLKFLKLKRQWISCSWPLRSDHLFLIPGDSPVGLRLPLNELPWTSPEDDEKFVQTDPAGIDPKDPFPEPRPLPLPEEADPNADKKTEKGKSAKWVLHTALCVESRNGHLHIFIPPVQDVGTYIELLNAVEATAEKLDAAVVIEGERPPPDPRIQQFSVTPDPGVIEVNIHPANSWDELYTITNTLFEETAQARLKPDKFMQDGRHTGSAGGCHIVLGGSTPAESPFLKNPELLASMVSYWQYHPSLSFMFSGLFLGPTSQSPRIDEARHDSLYELEIALNELKNHKEITPWLVDRLFRNLLTDLTGNTHRAEFCIDKLYNPDRSSGRLGLVELRSFEMPPHLQMVVSLQLIVRCLVAHLADKPFRPRRLVRWGVELHDRFMLPHFIWEDFLEVIHDLQENGLDIKADWYAPHFDFRFPLAGKLSYKEVEVELRQGIEPWHTLGEEATAGGTTRYVDSSLERLQVKVSSFKPERYEMRCNQAVLPLKPTGKPGEYVCGLRYRAWQPPQCLHPTIPPDTPLNIDLVDIRTGHIVAGCRYHSSHPGGRSFEDSPINSLEADGRWRSRFDPYGQTPGKAPEPKPYLSANEHPFTLDMRRLR